jgi:hypothetical protein
MREGQPIEFPVYFLVSGVERPTEGSCTVSNFLTVQHDGIDAIAVFSEKFLVTGWTVIRGNCQPFAVHDAESLHELLDVFEEARQQWLLWNPPGMEPFQEVMMTITEVRQRIISSD